MRTIIAKGFDGAEITQIKRYFSTVFTDVEVTTKDEETPVTMNTTMGPITRPAMPKKLRPTKLDDAALKIAFTHVTTQHAGMVKRLDNFCVSKNFPLLTGRSFNRFGNQLWIVGMRISTARYPLICMNNKGQLVGINKNALDEILAGTQPLDPIQTP